MATDQSTAANYNASDLLSASTMDIAKGTASVDLTFVHKLALVQVEVAGTMTGSGPSENLAITLRGCLAGGNFNLGDGILTTAGDAQAVKMLRVEKSGDVDYTTKYTYRALVPAQSVVIGTNLCLMAQNGFLYNTPAIAAALNLSAGDAKLYTAALPASVLQTVKITKGSFIMGSSDGTGANDMNPSPSEPNRDTDETQHSVTLTKDFYMSKYTITNAQYAAFLNDTGIGSNGQGSVTYYFDNFINAVTETQTFISGHAWGVEWDIGSNKWIPASGYENHPVILVTWYGAKAYADWIGGSLPTEAQWEYACRAGTITAYSFGDNSTSNIGGYAWYWDNSGNKTHPVGSKLPNHWGLYDMHGNVFEWCSDWYKYDYGSSAATDPTGPAAGNDRALRGGSWSNYAQYCRSAFRYGSYPGGAYFVGLRVVFVL